jgi:hypothetical protein
MAKKCSRQYLVNRLRRRKHWPRAREYWPVLLYYPARRSRGFEDEEKRLHRQKLEASMRRSMLGLRFPFYPPY